MFLPQRLDNPESREMDINDFERVKMINIKNIIDIVNYVHLNNYIKKIKL